MKALGELVSPNDPELVEKTLSRIAEQDRWNDVFSTKLIELLDKIDAVKSEIRDRIRVAEDVTANASKSLAAVQAVHEQALRTSLEAQRLLDQAAFQLTTATQ